MRPENPGESQAPQGNAQQLGSEQDLLVRIREARRRLAAEGPPRVRSGGDFERVSVPVSDSDVLRDVLLAEKPGTVIEIGLAYGSFDALVTDNLDLGRPDTIEIIFDRRVCADTISEFKTKVVSRGTEVTVNAFYKHSRIKQYLKDGRALRIETVVNAPGDLGCQRRLHDLDERQARARAVNARVLQTERAGQACVLANPVLERIAHPSVDAGGRRATAMRFGDSRVQALAGALAVTLCAVTGITNRSLRALMTGLLGTPTA
jgi:hypothetical protein